MGNNNEEIKRINGDEIVCPYCNSQNLKKYLYGEPTHDYDQEKYVLGGCEVSLDMPRYKCSDCGKDIYVERNTIIPDFSLEDSKDDKEED